MPTRSMLKDFRRPLASLAFVASGHLYALHVRLKLEYGGPVSFPLTTTERQVWRVFISKEEES